MTYTKRTLRLLPPETRRLAQRVNAIETAVRYLRVAVVPNLATHERIRLAENNRRTKANLQ